MKGLHYIDDRNVHGLQKAMFKLNMARNRDKIKPRTALQYELELIAACRKVVQDADSSFAR
jgi:hypothetical protein